jgi:hypothetical protein
VSACPTMSATKTGPWAESRTRRVATVWRNACGDSAMPARAITAVTILLIERTDQLLAGPRSHTGPLVTLGLLWWSAWWASHSRHTARSGRLSGTLRRRSPLPWRITSPPVRQGWLFTTAQREAWRLTAEHRRTNLRSVSEPEERGPGADPRDRLDERLEFHAFQPSRSDPDVAHVRAGGVWRSAALNSARWRSAGSAFGATLFGGTTYANASHRGSTRTSRGRLSRGANRRQPAAAASRRCGH